MTATDAGVAGLRAGMCSVTFRHLGVAEVAGLAAGAGLSAIEWGGDVHVPPGDLDAARAARVATAAAGLAVASYGSYLFCDGAAPGEAAAVCDTALELGTRLVRVWCPWGVGPDASAEQRGEVARSLRAVADVAEAREVDLYLEFHSDTLTATAESAADLLEAVGASNLWCGWQPPYWSPIGPEAELAELALLGPRLAHVHVYAWDAESTRHPLASEVDSWDRRLRAVGWSAGGRSPSARWERFALLEFVVDDDPHALAPDAAVLVDLLEPGKGP